MSAAEYWCLAAIGAAAVLGILLERLRPYNRGQALFRPGFWTDLLLYGLAQSYAMGVLIGRLLGSVDKRLGWSARHPLSHWPILLQIAFFLVTHDLYIYWFHRWQHSSPLLWRIHEAHHSVKNVDWLSGVRSHSLEILVNQSIEFGPMVLLGAAPIVPVIKGTISAIWGMFIHANIDVRLGVLQRVVNGPEMHRWHHALAEAAKGRNYSTKFAFWDWLFGTAYLPDRDRNRATRYGLAGEVTREQFPQTWIRQQLRPFTRRHAGGRDR